MKSKKTNYAEVYDPKNNIINIYGMWSDKQFRRMIDEIGIKQIQNVIVHDGGTLHLKSFDLDRLTICRYGFVSASLSMLSNVTNDGILRVRNSTVKHLTNDGQAYVSQESKLQHAYNNRHLEISRSYAYGVVNEESSSIKATSSFLVKCSACQTTAIYLGSSKMIDCTDALFPWSAPAFDSPDITPFIMEFRLLFAAIELISSIDYIDSKFVCTDKRMAKMIKFIDMRLAKGYTLPFDVSKDLISTVSFLSTKAQDNLRKMVGYRAIVFGPGGVVPKPIIKKKKK